MRSVLSYNQLASCHSKWYCFCVASVVSFVFVCLAVQARRPRRATIQVMLATLDGDTRTHACAHSVSVRAHTHKTQTRPPKPPTGTQPKTNKAGQDYTTGGDHPDTTAKPSGQPPHHRSASGAPSPLVFRWCFGVLRCVPFALVVLHLAAA